MRNSLALALALVALLPLACSSSTPEPDTTTMAGDGDGDVGDGDGDGPLADLPEQLPDVAGDLPSEGLAACCICQGNDSWCEFDTATTQAECDAYGENWNSPSEWHTDCEDGPSGAYCPNSCAA